MNICIVATTEDDASLNMYAQLVKLCSKTQYVFDSTSIFEKKVGENNIYLVKWCKRSVDSNNLDILLKNVIGNFDIILFLSKHASVSQIPTLCIHTQGNWGKAQLGGSDKVLGVCPVVLKNKLYVKMVADNPTEYDVVHEATHHGPDLNTPCIFYEIGSTKKEWNDELLGMFMIRTLLETLKSYEWEQTKKPAFFGIGGSHTCSNYNRLSAESKALISHVIPNYAVENLSVGLVKQALKKATIASQVVVDWKALNSSQRKFVHLILEQADISYTKLKQFKLQFDAEHI